MEWTHLACLLAGTFVGSFLMTVWQNERAYRRRERDFTVPVRLADGWWFPKAKGPPPPAPAPPPPAPAPPPK